MLVAMMGSKVWIISRDCWQVCVLANWWKIVNKSTTVLGTEGTLTVTHDHLALRVGFLLDLYSSCINTAFGAFFPSQNLGVFSKASFSSPNCNSQSCVSLQVSHCSTGSCPVLYIISPCDFRTPYALLCHLLPSLKQDLHKSHIYILFFS